MELPKSAPPSPASLESKESGIPEISLKSIQLVRQVSHSAQSPTELLNTNSIISHAAKITRQLSEVKEFILLSPEEQLSSIHSVLKEKIDSSRLDGIISDETETQILDTFLHTILPAIVEGIIGKPAALICESTCTTVLKTLRSICKKNTAVN